MQGVSRSPKEVLTGIKGISEITAERIMAWFGNPENLRVAQQLVELWQLHEGASENGATSTVDQQQGSRSASSITLAGIALEPGDEIVATGAIAVTRDQIAKWYEIQPTSAFGPPHIACWS